MPLIPARMPELPATPDWEAFYDGAYKYRHIASGTTYSTMQRINVTGTGQPLTKETLLADCISVMGYTVKAPGVYQYLRLDSSLNNAPPQNSATSGVTLLAAPVYQLNLQGDTTTSSKAAQAAWWHDPAFAGGDETNVQMTAFEPDSEYIQIRDIVIYCEPTDLDAEDLINAIPAGRVWIYNFSRDRQLKWTNNFEPPFRDGNPEGDRLALDEITLRDIGMYRFGGGSHCVTDVIANGNQEYGQLRTHGVDFDGDATFNTSGSGGGPFECKMIYRIGYTALEALNCKGCGADEHWHYRDAPRVGNNPPNPVSNLCQGNFMKAPKAPGEDPQKPLGASRVLGRTFYQQVQRAIPAAFLGGPPGQAKIIIHGNRIERAVRNDGSGAITLWGNSGPPTAYEVTDNDIGTYRACITLSNDDGKGSHYTNGDTLLAQGPWPANLTAFQMGRVVLEGNLCYHETVTHSTNIRQAAIRLIGYELCELGFNDVSGIIGEDTIRIADHNANNQPSDPLQGINWGYRTVWRESMFANGNPSQMPGYGSGKIRYGDPDDPQQDQPPYSQYGTGSNGYLNAAGVDALPTFIGGPWPPIQSEVDRPAYGPNQLRSWSPLREMCPASTGVNQRYVGQTSGCSARWSFANNPTMECEVINGGTFSAGMPVTIGSTGIVADCQSNQFTSQGMPMIRIEIFSLGMPVTQGTLVTGDDSNGLPVPIAVVPAISEQVQGILQCWDTIPPYATGLPGGEGGQLFLDGETVTIPNPVGGFPNSFPIDTPYSQDDLLTWGGFYDGGGPVYWPLLTDEVNVDSNVLSVTAEITMELLDNAPKVDDFTIDASVLIVIPRLLFNSFVTIGVDETITVESQIALSVTEDFNVDALALITLPRITLEDVGDPNTPGRPPPVDDSLGLFMVDIVAKIENKPITAVVGGTGTGVGINAAERDLLRAMPGSPHPELPLGADRMPAVFQLMRSSGIWEVNNGGSMVRPTGANSSYIYTKAGFGFSNTIAPQDVLNPAVGLTNPYNHTLANKYADETFRVPAWIWIRGGGFRVTVWGGLLNTSGASKQFQKTIAWDDHILVNGTDTDDPGTVNAFGDPFTQWNFVTQTVTNTQGLPDGLSSTAGNASPNDDLLVPFVWETQVMYSGVEDGTDDGRFRIWLESQLRYGGADNQGAGSLARSTVDEVTKLQQLQSAITGASDFADMQTQVGNVTLPHYIDTGEWTWRRRLQGTTVGNETFEGIPDPREPHYFAVRFMTQNSAGTWGNGDPMMRIEGIDVTGFIADAVRG